MSEKDYEFTSTEEIDEYRRGNSLMQLTGWICGIDGCRAIKPPQKWIYTLVLDNADGRKIRVLFWGEKALKFKEELTMNEIIEITGGTISSSNPAFKNPAEKVVSVEFNVTSNSRVIKHGTYSDRSISRNPNVTFTPVSIAKVLWIDGPISVQGFLKVNFEIIKIGGSSSYGGTVLGHSVYRLNVRIAAYRPHPSLIAGVHVKMDGELVEDKHGNHYLQIADMDHVYIDETQPKVERCTLRKAIRQPLPKPKELPSPLLLTNDSTVSDEPTIKKSKTE